MNGAESLVRTLVGGGVDVCFTNPGTSEMHFVAALDRVEGMRCVLGLFEGVVTGAADGYARMADKPAATLLHLGPGLANGGANLHNARRAFTPIVNIVGDHAVYHLQHDAPLTSDIEGIARPFSHWVKTSPTAETIAADGAEAIRVARTAPGQIATLILPADTAWNDGTGPAPVAEPPAREKVTQEAIREAADMLRRDPQGTLILITGQALRVAGTNAAGSIAAKTGCQVLAQTSNGRTERGAGRFSVERIPYPVDQAIARLKDFRQVILVGAKAPVGFFAYPGKPSVMTAPGTNIFRLATIEQDLIHTLEWLADEVGAKGTPARMEPAARPALSTGKLTVDACANAIGHLMPENCIVADEAVTSGRGLFPFTKGAPPHDWLQITGGAIGLGLPLATGAAVACPDRKVLCLEGDGSGMYTVQALWTMARENLNVVNVIFSNRSYAILRGELHNVGAHNPGRKAIDMLSLDRPDLNWVDMARGMGVPGSRAETAEEFNEQLARAIATPGPYLIEAVI
ncbi:acetolactate synthase large subunit [Stella sp.]|uniref:acetolactate synthase large subunit n=1 Tax=Stella sp. TaxID=2912054 RepID=UPI0035B3785B